MSHTKLCVCYLFDDNTAQVFAEISEEISSSFQEIYSPTVTGRSLPYHLTMFAGIEVSSECVSGVVKYFEQVVCPFSGRAIPRVGGIEPCVTNGHNCGVRYKFVEGSYVLTGNKKLNEHIIDFYCPTFLLDDIRHVSVGTVPSFQELDRVIPTLRKVIAKREQDLLRAVFVPSIWKKDYLSTWERVV